MKMDLFFINLLIGLVRNVEAKVHVNGLYTRSFPLERGVMEGDPLSPLLFALSSQPLMSLLEAKQANGKLFVLSIPKHKGLLYQLFVMMLAFSYITLQRNLSVLRHPSRFLRTF